MKTNRAAAAGALGIAAALTVAIALSGPAAQGASAPVDDERISGRADLNVTGLTDDGRLVKFESRFPNEIEVVGAITGLTGDTGVIGIDYRVQNNLLYAVGNAGGIYTVSTDDASATKVSQLSVALAGASFGVDFNPAADRLRVISDTGQNLRHDLNTGTTINDGALTYPAVPPGEPTPGVNITAAAYTNNDLDPLTSTTLFDIDTMLDQVVVQSPANAGLLAATGKLGNDASSNAGFDIYSKLRGGKAVEVEGFAVLQVDGRSVGFKINLLNGDSKRLRGFPVDKQVIDVAMPLNQR